MPSDTASVPSTRVRGVVKWFRPSHETKFNFGFLTTAAGEDIFVHGKNVLEDRTLEEGDKVEFSIKHGRDGKPTAGDVRRVNSVLPANFRLPGGA